MAKKMRKIIVTLLGIKPPTRLRWASRTGGKKASLMRFELLIFFTAVRCLDHSANRAGDAERPQILSP